MKGRVSDQQTMAPEASAEPPRLPPPGWLRQVTVMALVVITLGLVMLNAGGVGVARDETVYMSAGGRYAAWWMAAAEQKKGVVGEQGITDAFGGPGATDGNREHPPLMKTLFGLSDEVFHRRLHWMGSVAANRLPTAAMHALLISLVFLMTQALWGWAEGVVASLLLLLMPRLFFHAGLACFDAPIAALWFATIYVWWRGLSSKGWMLGCGAVFGLALATKHNALILPVALAAHYLVIAGHGASGWRVGNVAGGVIRRRPLALVSLAVLGPLVLVALWPWLWFDTFGHVKAWIGFHLHHVHYNFEYLGQNWNHPRFPWHVAIVTTLLTVPAATLAAAAVGIGAWSAKAWRGEAPDGQCSPGLLLVISAAAAMGPFLLGSTPIFGAEKHWAPAMPSLAIAAGVGVVWAARAAVAKMAAARPAARAGLERTALSIVAIAVVGSAAIETWHDQPYALTSYNAIAGGAPGGADLGMNRQFWGYAARGVLPFLRTQAPVPGEPARLVYSHDASPAWGIYVRDGLLPASLNDAGGEYSGGIERSQLAIVVHEKHFNRHDYLIWKAYGTVRPVFVLRFDGVPIVSVYRRPALPQLQVQ